MIENETGNAFAGISGFVYSFNKISQISLQEFFFARSLAFTFIFCIFSGEEKSSSKIAFASSCFLIQIATCLCSKKAAFSSSWPGIGFITIIGRP